MSRNINTDIHSHSYGGNGGGGYGGGAGGRGGYHPNYQGGNGPGNIVWDPSHQYQVPVNYQQPDSNIMNLLNMIQINLVGLSKQIDELALRQERIESDIDLLLCERVHSEEE